MPAIDRGSRPPSEKYRAMEILRGRRASFFVQERPDDQHTQW